MCRWLCRESTCRYAGRRDADGAYSTSRDQPMPSRGFRWADVILLVGLAFVAVGLLLPAIGRSRDSQARQRSVNNLKQIALAVHSYADAHKTNLPPLTDVGQGAP